MTETLTVFFFTNGNLWLLIHYLQLLALLCGLLHYDVFVACRLGYRVHGGDFRFRLGLLVLAVNFLVGGLPALIC